MASTSVVPRVAVAATRPRTVKSISHAAAAEHVTVPKSHEVAAPAVACVGVRSPPASRQAMVPVVVGAVMLTKPSPAGKVSVTLSGKVAPGGIRTATLKSAVSPGRTFCEPPLEVVTSAVVKRGTSKRAVTVVATVMETRHEIG